MPQSHSTNSSISRLNERIKNFPFDHSSWSPLSRPLTMDLYKNWIEKDYHGEMSYLKAHIPAKEDPQLLLSRAKTAIMVTQSYLPHPHSPPPEFPLKALRIAQYAQGEDYHHWFKKNLQKLANELQSDFPDEVFTAFTDSSPVLERDYAQRAGLGWFGKNTCLIHSKKGSLFFIGEIYTSLELDSSNIFAHPDRCGTCTRCIDICPTQALVKPYELDARKCISYLTIESSSVPPENLRKSQGDWFFGCDLCQSVCPWNEHHHGKILMNQLTHEIPVSQRLEEDLRWILTTSNKSLMRQLKGSPLMRAGGRGLKRNAIIVCANKNIQNLQPELKLFLNHPRLGELAQWALAKLS